MISSEHLLFYLVLALYFAAAIFYFTGYRRDFLLKTAQWLSGLALAANLLLLLNRISLSGRLPLANSYEFLLSFTFITAFIYVIYEIISDRKSTGGVLMSINAFLLLTIMLFIPWQIGRADPLMPALKSPWLTVHVITAIIAYSAFTLAAGIAIIQLKHAVKEEDTFIYRLTAGGFAMLSLSIVLGAVWAEQVWGSYWTWDPKETWALVTWIIYAIYLHLHRRREWQGDKARVLIIAGFILVLFTFFGVNYLLPGLHSYA